MEGMEMRGRPSRLAAMENLAMDALLLAETAAHVSDRCRKHHREIVEQLRRLDLIVLEAKRGQRVA